MKLKSLMIKQDTRIALMLCAILFVIFLGSSCTTKKKIAESYTSVDSASLKTASTSTVSSIKTEHVKTVDTTSILETTAETTTVTESEFALNPTTGQSFKKSEKQTKTEKKKTTETKTDKHQEKISEEKVDSARSEAKEEAKVAKVTATKTKEVEKQKWWVPVLLYGGVAILLLFFGYKIYKLVRSKNIL